MRRNGTEAAVSLRAMRGIDATGTVWTFLLRSAIAGGWLVWVVMGVGSIVGTVAVSRGYV